MPVPVAIQAPFCDSGAVELAAGGRYFWKDVLRTGSLDYKGRRLDFTGDYLDNLALAHREGAYDMVPLVFAPQDNAHTQAVEQIRGDIVGFKRDGDRLRALVHASSDEAAATLRDNPRIGCSVRIEQPLERGDGKTWPAAIQHVLATANPRVNGLGPWEPVDLAVDDRPVLDLSALTFAAHPGADEAPIEEEPMADTPAPFTDEETATLRALLADYTQQAQGTDAESAGGWQEPTDEELAALAAQLLADDEFDDGTGDDADAAAAYSGDTQEPVGASLSAGTTEAIELANGRADRMEIELAQLRTERDTTRYEQLRDRLATESHIPPRITELAKPLLLGSQHIELSDGSRVDASDVMRQVLTAVGEHVKLLDLSDGAQVVYDDGGDGEKAAADSRSAEMRDYMTTYGL